MLKEPTKIDNFKASFPDKPLLKPKAKAPLKASPAPVVSIAFIFGAFKYNSLLSIIAYAPLSPKVIITFLQPKFFNFFAAFFALFLFLIFILVSSKASCSFGVM